MSMHGTSTLKEIVKKAQGQDQHRGLAQVLPYRKVRHLSQLVEVASHQRSKRSLSKLNRERGRVHGTTAPCLRLDSLIAAWIRNICGANRELVAWVEVEESH